MSDDVISTAAELDAAMKVLRRRGVTQRQLASELGVSVPAVWMWRKERLGVPRYCASYLAAKYGITKQSVADAA